MSRIPFIINTRNEIEEGGDDDDDDDARSPISSFVNGGGASYPITLVAGVIQAGGLPSMSTPKAQLLEPGSGVKAVDIPRLIFFNLEAITTEVVDDGIVLVVVVASKPIVFFNNDDDDDFDDESLVVGIVFAAANTSGDGL
jgi:hypothetical protein